MLTKPEIRQLGEKALREEIASARNELLKIQFAVRNGTSKESSQVKKLRRYVAGLKTIQRELKSGSPMPEEKKESPKKTEKDNKDIAQPKVKKTSLKAKKEKI